MYCYSNCLVCLACHCTPKAVVSFWGLRLSHLGGVRMQAGVSRSGGSFGVDSALLELDKEADDRCSYLTQHKHLFLKDTSLLQMQKSSCTNSLVTKKNVVTKSNFPFSGGSCAFSLIIAFSVYDVSVVDHHCLACPGVLIICLDPVCSIPFQPRSEAVMLTISQHLQRSP